MRSITVRSFVVRHTDAAMLSTIALETLWTIRGCDIPARRSSATLTSVAPAHRASPRVRLLLPQPAPRAAVCTRASRGQTLASGRAKTYPLAPSRAGLPQHGGWLQRSYYQHQNRLLPQRNRKTYSGSVHAFALLLSSPSAAVNARFRQRQLHISMTNPLK